MIALTSSRLAAFVCPAVLALSTGCSHAVPPTTPVAYESNVVAAPPPAPAPAKASAVNVSANILKACGIDDSPTGEAPLFAFDSATLSHGDQHLLGEVARCVTQGPLAGRALKLVGHADPRGTEDYNQRLGDSRAASVERFLEHHGMTPAKLTESSRGALDASGHDENGWKMDRRVDVDLVNN